MVLYKTTHCGTAISVVHTWEESDARGNVFSSAAVMMHLLNVFVCIMYSMYVRIVQYFTCTVEPPNKGQLGTGHFVPCSEVGLS